MPKADSSCLNFKTPNKEFFIYLYTLEIKEDSGIQNVNYIYKGIPTFMGSDFVKRKDIKKYDVVFVGVPSNYGVCFRSGTKHARRANSDNTLRCEG
ncbi:MAG: hypothetical protein LBH37_03550 [Oscillospiraceae bacterium]|jgi:hypothetical protein|nr:hypothetical protein [Oscillospiraceae bacterium]